MRVLIVFDDMIVDMESNKKLGLIVTVEKRSVEKKQKLKTKGLQRQIKEN